MSKLNFAAMVLFFVAFPVSAKAQQFESASPAAPSTADKPVWALEFVKVKPGMFSATMGYLDDNWLRLRAEAKREGVVLNYNRVAGGESGGSEWDILLMTEYKNRAAYDGREKLFDSILKRLPNKTSEVIKGYKKEELFQSVKTRILQDFSENAYPQVRLLTRK